MKLLSGVILLVGAEHAYAHAQLVQFPNQDAASSVLIPASLLLLLLGICFTIWGLVSECRSCKRSGGQSGVGE